MRKLILTLAVAASSITPVEASSTTITAAPTSSVAGQSVTFTATFTSSCPGAVTAHWFTIDGAGINGTFAQSGQAGSETLSISTLAVGSHNLSYYWKIAGTICQGIAEMSYTVSPKPSPSPTPPPSPSPIPSPTPSPASVGLLGSQRSDSSFAGYIGGGLIVLVLVLGAALMVLARR